MHYTTKVKWIEALRSGKYPQGKGMLVDSSTDPARNTYCCLGVLACVLNPGVAPPRACDESRGPTNGDELLGEEALTEAGLDPDEQNKLANFNDAGESFTTIAQYIEENL